MGYRSNVVSLVYGKPEKVDAFLVRLKLEGNTAFDKGGEGWGEYVRVINLDNDTKVLMLDVEDRKWYQGYPHVDNWEKMQDNAEEFGLSFEFARVGEEAGDIETINAGDDLQYFLSTHTNICNEIEGNESTPL